MNKKRLLSVLIACATAASANAQQTTSAQPAGKELNKEITLEKDFVPVEKKVTKKATLPKVKKITPPAKTNLDYSDTPVDITMPNTIPTMMPYGYRTAHNFSDKRGYLEVGGGMQANFDGSAGYRFLDSDNSQAGIWVQHNSTWAGKNNSTLIPDDKMRTKQLFNDNRAGLYFNQHLKAGTLKLDAGVHFDSFNYYGAHKMDDLTNYYDADKKQALLEFGVNGAWDGKLKISDNDLYYRANASFNHAGYDMVPEFYAPDAKGAKENVVQFGIGGDYEFEFGTVTLDLKGDYVNFKGAQNYDAGPLPVDHNEFVFTVAPRYKWENDVFRAQAGFDLVLGDIFNNVVGATGNEGKFHIAPVVKLDVDIVDGAAIFVDLKGGNTINSLSHMASLDRYSTPLGMSTNTWRPIDGEAGFKFGPFAGFSAKLFAGYGMAKGQLVRVSEFTTFQSDLYAANTYQGYKMRGVKFGGEINYKYRSLVDVAASLTYAPGNDDLTSEWLNGYSLGLDGARMVADANVKVTPIRQLAVELGMNYRGQRRFIENDKYVDLNNAFNLHAGATWRFDKTLAVWVKANNLLNRKYDVMPGQGAQLLNVMGGVSLVF